MKKIILFFLILTLSNQAFCAEENFDLAPPHKNFEQWESLSLEEKIKIKKHHQALIEGTLEEKDFEKSAQKKARQK